MLIALSSLSVKANNTATIDSVNTQKRTTQIDTVKFVNDTAWVAETPKVSHIVYADNSSSSNVIGEYIFPIIMLLLGIGIDRFIVWRGEKSRMRKTGKRWIAELRSILTPIENQKSSLSSFIVDYCDKADQYSIPDLTVEQSLDGSRFKILNKEDLYEYLEKTNKNEFELLYRKITNIASSLEFTRTQLIGKCNDMLGSSGKYVSQYNSCCQDYRLMLSDAVSGLLNHPLAPEDNAELRRLFDATFDNPQKEDNVFHSEDEFVNPSIDILRKYSHKDEKYLQMIHTLVRCLDCIKGLKMEKQYIKVSYEKIANIYNRLYTATEDVLKLLDNKK